jgi:hypothetical protein
MDRHSMYLLRPLHVITIGGRVIESGNIIIVSREFIINSPVAEREINGAAIEHRRRGTE